MSKIQKVIDIAKELGGIDITWHGEIGGFMLQEKPNGLTEEDLKSMMEDPRYWRDQDPVYVKQIHDGWQQLYGDKYA